MYVSAVLLALVLTAPSESPQPVWQTDYAKSLQIAKESRKPIAVVIGSGQEGWKSICTNGSLGDGVTKLLAENYVCTYVDASDSRNHKLVQDFETRQYPTLVISDRGGALQMHRQVGAMESTQLQGTLQRLASAPGPIVTQQSFYQATGQAQPAQAYPYYQGQGWSGHQGGFGGYYSGGFSGGGCRGCR